MTENTKLLVEKYSELENTTRYIQTTSFKKEDLICLEDLHNEIEILKEEIEKKCAPFYS